MSRRARQPRREVNPVSIAAVFYVLSLIGFILAFQVPTGRIWALNFGAFAPASYTWIVAAGGLLAGIAAILLTQKRPGWLEDGSPLPYWPAALTIGVLTIVAFIVLRLQTHFGGDGYQLLAAIQTGSVAPKAWDRGTLLALQALNSLFGAASATSALEAYRVFSISAGFCFVILCLTLTRRIIDNTSGQLVLLVGLLSGGYTLHFYGHVENYAWLVLAALATGLLGLAAARDTLGKWWVLLPVAVGAVSHIFGLILVPAAVIILVKDTKWWKSLSNLSWYVWLLIAIGVVVAAIFAVEVATDKWLFVRFSLLPIGSDRFTVGGYTLFSGAHVTDLLNLLFLLCPGVLIWMSGGFTLQRPTPSERTSIIFLGALSLPALMLGFLAEPKLGMARDWDLFTFTLVPLCLWLFWSLARKTRHHPRLLIVGIMGAIFGWLLIVPKLAVWNDNERAVKQFEYFLDLDFMRSRNGYRILHDFFANQGDSARGKAYVARSDTLYPERVFAAYGLRLMHVGDYRSSLLQFQRALQRDPLFSDAYTGVAYSYSHLGILDSSIAYFTVAEAMNPYNPHIQSGLGQSLVGINELDLAEDHLLLAIRLDTTYFSPYANLAYIYGARRDSVNAARFLHALARHPASPAERFHALATVFNSAGLTTLAEEAEAEAAKREALEQPPDSVIGLQPQTDSTGR